MKYIDLTQTVSEGMQTYPGDPHFKTNEYLVFEKDYCHVNLMQMGSHTGTHIDAPYHFFQEGKSITDYPIKRFINKGLLIDVSGKKAQEPINKFDLLPFQATIKPDDFVIFKTGWDNYWGHDHYLKHPYLSPEISNLLVTLRVGLVGIDALNVDPTLKNSYPAHEILLGNDILIVENLCNLKFINQSYGSYSFLPLKLDSSDGSPIRAVHFYKDGI